MQTEFFGGNFPRSLLLSCTTLALVRDGMMAASPMVKALGARLSSFIQAHHE